MDVVEKVREGLEDFLDSEKSESFKAIGGSEEISKLAMSDDNFIEAIIEGSMEYDTQSFFFKKYPTEDGIAEFIGKLDEIAEENGNSYNPLVDAYIAEPEKILEMLKGNELETISLTFAEYNVDTQNLAQQELQNDLSGAIALTNSENPAESIVSSLDIDTSELKNASGDKFIQKSVAVANLQKVPEPALAQNNM